MNKTTESSTNKQGHPRLILIVLVLVFSAPLLSAWFVLNYTSLVNAGGASYGDLYDPLVELPNVPLQDPYAPAEDKQLYGKWSLFYMNEGECDEACRQQIYSMRQIRLALSRYARNLQRVWMTDIDNPAQLKEILADYEGTLVMPMDKVSGRIAPADFAMPPVNEPLENDALYAIDPQGRVVLRYREGYKPAGVIDDLKRLLKNTRID